MAKVGVVERKFVMMVSWMFYTNLLERVQLVMTQSGLWAWD